MPLPQLKQSDKPLPMAMTRLGNVMMASLTLFGGGASDVVMVATSTPLSS